MKPDPVAVEFAKRCGSIRALDFDILTRPGPELSAEERDEVKKLARELLERLKALLVLGWRQKIQSRAKVRIAIEDTLDEGLPRAYTKKLFVKKTEVLFEHLYEAYKGDEVSVYAGTTSNST